ncbi:MAG: hypothetical protein HN793_07400, partial [Rhodospirillaceae bacterium]|nr:hypothetical protein [Rhodospirillaceae bacterium]
PGHVDLRRREVEDVARRRAARAGELRAQALAAGGVALAAQQDALGRHGVCAREHRGAARVRGTHAERGRGLNERGDAHGIKDILRYCMTNCVAGGFVHQCDRAHSPKQRAVCLAACALLLVVSTGVLVALVAEHEALRVHRRLLMQYRYDNKTIAFPAHGSLRVLHFTDVQIASFTDTCKNYAGPCDAGQSVRFLQRLLAEDRPDLVVLGGDNVDGKHGDAAAREVLTRILEPIRNARIPFVAILGNHDIYRYQMSVSDMHAFFQEQGALFSGNGVLGIQDGQDTICQIFLLDYMYQFTLLWAFYQHIPTHALATVGLPTGISRDRNENSITAEQVAWFERQVRTAPPRPLSSRTFLCRNTRHCTPRTGLGRATRRRRAFQTTQQVHRCGRQWRGQTLTWLPSATTTSTISAAGTRAGPTSATLALLATRHTDWKAGRDEPATLTSAEREASRRTNAWTTRRCR